MPASLDDFIATPTVRERHETVVSAPAEVVFATACDFDLLSIPLVHAIFWLRSRFFRATPPPRSWKGLVAETRGLGWGSLVEVPHRLYVAGAACQPWVGDVVFTAIPADRFAAYAEPNMVKIIWTVEAEPLGPERTRLATETRVQPTDEHARQRFRRYWRLTGTGIVLIRWLLLPAIRREAERRWHSPAP
ncbi:MAG TPA: hypothetical protein VIQ60_09985 [Gemmatimonadaceae bacterium]